MTGSPSSFRMGTAAHGASTSRGWWVWHRMRAGVYTVYLALARYELMFDKSGKWEAVDGITGDDESSLLYPVRDVSWVYDKPLR